MPKNDLRLIESDDFPVEFLSLLAERESWRKEIHRPVYHVHKWWAKRLGSVFRGILLGAALPRDVDLRREFYRFHTFSDISVFDPFMGSGTTVGEAHKLGFTALGRDINPVAFESVSTALGPLDRQKLLSAFEEISNRVGKRIRALYQTLDSRNKSCEALYFFWVMQTECPACGRNVDLFSSYVVARNAYPKKKPEIQVLCPRCGDIFPGTNGRPVTKCRSCRHEFDPTTGSARGSKAACTHCNCEFRIVDAMERRSVRPGYRMYGKLVLTADQRKEYLPASMEDHASFEKISKVLQHEFEAGAIKLPQSELESGHNTRQALRYAFRSWRDFFNDRQLLALGWLQNAIEQVSDVATRKALLTLFSGTLEFNNLFASYKGEGTGAVRHMFSHHILKPERNSIEANVWGTPKSSGSFSNLFRSRLLRAVEYRHDPTEVSGKTGRGRVCSPSFSGLLAQSWPIDGMFATRGVYLSCGDSTATGLPSKSIDLVVTDPPFFDNVHYSELADFFFSWQQLANRAANAGTGTTRSPREVQDADPIRFAEKLQGVFRECGRVLKDDGLLVFTYHHSRSDGWSSLAEAIFGSGFMVVNSQPVKAEMSVATPKSQAKDPIQLDIVVVCRKRATPMASAGSVDDAIASARQKLERLTDAGINLSRNDRRVALNGQLLTTLEIGFQCDSVAARIEEELNRPIASRHRCHETPQQRLLFDDSESRELPSSHQT